MVMVMMIYIGLPTSWSDAGSAVDSSSHDITQEYSQLFVRGQGHTCSLHSAMQLSRADTCTATVDDSMAVLCSHGCVTISMGFDSCIGSGLLAVPIHQPSAVVLQSALSCVPLPLTRLSDTPLETACEVGIIASLSQLRVLEFGIIYDGSSQHADVPRALEAIGELSLLQVRGLGLGAATHSAYNWCQHLLHHLGVKGEIKEWIVACIGFPSGHTGHQIGHQ